MEDLVIKYLNKCPICGNGFYAKRRHARTCSTRCRFILHKLGKSLENFKAMVDFDINKMPDDIIQGKAEYVKEKHMVDKYGNVFELIGGFTDNNGDMVRVIFRNNGLKYINVWNLKDDIISEEVYKFQ